MASAPNESYGWVIGAILTGGQSARFGSDKALATIEGTGQRMGDRVRSALRACGVDPIVAVGGDAGQALGLPTVPDRWPGEGPLAGIATVLLWARRGHVLVVPCDLPLLDGEALAPFLEVVRQHGGVDQAYVATVDGEVNYQLCCLPAAWGPAVLEKVRAGERRYRAILEIGHCVRVPIVPTALADADTPGELVDLLSKPGSEKAPGPPPD